MDAATERLLLCIHSDREEASSSGASLAARATPLQEEQLRSIRDAMAVMRQVCECVSV